MAVLGAGFFFALTSTAISAEDTAPAVASTSALTSASAASPAQAAGPAADPLTMELDLMGKRLRRGTANAGLGWLEIPAGVQEIGHQHGIGAAATWGLVHGSGRAVQRTAVGLFEILTFPFKLTQNNKPIIEPEFVLDKPKPEVPAPAPAETPPSS